MSRYWRDADAIRLDIADAIGADECPIEYLRRRHEREWSR